jgi:hypothetical protein
MCVCRWTHYPWSVAHYILAHVKGSLYRSAKQYYIALIENATFLLCVLVLYIVWITAFHTGTASLQLLYAYPENTSINKDVFERFVRTDVVCITMFLRLPGTDFRNQDPVCVSVHPFVH